MKRVLLPALLAMAVLGLSGCGTVCNLVSNDRQVYGGVQKDFEFMMTPRNFGAGHNNGFGVLALFLLVPADGFLSLMGDTLTLPLVVWLRQNPPTDREPVYFMMVGDGGLDGADNANRELAAPPAVTFSP